MGNELEQRPKDLATILTEKFWEFVDKGLVVESEILRITSGHGPEGGFGTDEMVTQLSREFGGYIRNNGVVLPVISMDGLDVRHEVAIGLIRNLTGASPKGLLGDWRSDEAVFMTERRDTKVVRTRLSSSGYREIPTITYKAVRDLTAD